MSTKLLVTALFLALASASSACGQSLEWTRQHGTSENEFGYGVSSDGLGNVYISGSTWGSLGAPNAGRNDAFLSKYDTGGALQWTRQIGSIELDHSVGVSADGLGSVYIAGQTSGGLVGNSAGERDVFLSKYDDAGTLHWTRQFGGSDFDYAKGISADGLGSVYVSGYSRIDPRTDDYDAFLSKYDEDGTHQWTSWAGTSSDDRSFAVATDGLGSVYIAGRTHGRLEGTNAGGSDAFLSKYDDAGTHQWTRQFGTSESDTGSGVSPDGLGSVYISGHTSGSLDGTNAGSSDAFLSKYDDAGTHQWTRQFGTGDGENSRGVSADGLGAVYISGFTRGSLDGTNAGGNDAFLSKFDAGGTHQWTEQLGTIDSDVIRGVSADGLGSVYIAGDTRGSLGQLNAGGPDPFIAKFNEQPSEPPPTIRTWTFEATVIDLDDTDNIFLDVRVGDPVRGFISYDLATPGEMDGVHDELFDHGFPFQVANMVVENPRGGSDLEFAPANTFARVWVTNDDHDEALGEFDEITIIQPVSPTAGFSGTGPAVTVDLSSPEAISSTSLPETLDLADWPLATISFLDVFDLNGSYLDAEIFSLTPLETTGMSGDFNGDGVVNAADYSVWRDGMGTTYTQADYDVWKANFGTIRGIGSARAAQVPESATCVMVWAMIAGATACSRPRIHMLLHTSARMAQNYIAQGREAPWPRRPGSQTPNPLALKGPNKMWT